MFSSVTEHNDIDIDKDREMKICILLNHSKSNFNASEICLKAPTYKIQLAATDDDTQILIFYVDLMKPH